MPCYSDPTPTPDEVAYGRKREAVECAIWTALEKSGLLGTVLDAADWNEAGVSREFAEQWWERHKESDRLRRAREQQEADRRAAKQAALEKLSESERRALGL